VQTVRPLGPDTGLKLTTARYYTPSGKSIQARGIVPDVLVDESEEGNLFSAAAHP
jgi:carboxyl-terminal processing protease